jgi:glycosyltransferase involved in cell wall biosynthesis
MRAVPGILTPPCDVPGRGGKRVRVVIVSKALVAGAYQRKIEELAKLSDLELTAIVPPGWRDPRDPWPLQHAYTHGYDLVVAPLAFNGRYHLHFYPTLGRLLRGLRPDVLHMDEEPYNLATWHGLRIGQSLGVRGLFFTWQNLARSYPWPFRYFEASNYRRAAHAIAGNQGAAGVLRSKGYRGPVAVIPQFGVDPDVFSPASIKAYPGTAGATPSFRETARQRPPLIIGYAGRLVAEKGIDVLMQACALLPLVDWRLCLLGDGPDRRRFEALAAKLNIAGQVQFLGRLPSTEVAGFYRMLDVLVLPSVSRPNWIEQFGRVLIEAMSCAVPVIGSSSGEIPNVIGDAGLIFPEGDVAALRGKLASLADDAAGRAELAARGRARVLAHFTHARIAAETHRVYQEVMDHRRATDPEADQ